MKNIIIRSAVTMSVILAAGCGGMDETYKEFVVPGGLTYPQRAVNPTVYSGDGRLMIKWDASNDASVSKAVIYWENKAYSEEVAITGGEEEVSALISPLAEGDYNFIIHTFDDMGNKSVPVELNGVVYGDIYRTSLFSRPVVSAMERAGELTIEWGAADVSNYMYQTEISYTDLLGANRTVLVDNSEIKTVIDDLKPGSNFDYRSLFAPGVNNLDIFYTPWQHANFMLDKTTWTATSDNFEPDAQLPLGGPPQFVLDYRTDTFWHTQHSAAQVPYPHWLAVDMNSPVSIYAVELTRRPGVGDNFQQYTLQGSDNGTDWEDIGVYPFLYQDGTQRAVVPSGTVYRHVRIYATEGPHPWAHLAEFSVIGRYVE